jgi:hypothetical protein
MRSEDDARMWWPDATGELRARQCPERLQAVLPATRRSRHHGGVRVDARSRADVDRVRERDEDRALVGIASSRDAGGPDGIAIVVVRVLPDD